MTSQELDRIRIALEQVSITPAMCEKRLSILTRKELILIEDLRGAISFSIDAFPAMVPLDLACTALMLVATDYLVENLAADGK